MRADLAAQPFASVITPFYNTELYLAECIESVLAQSHQNFEYILVDNQSTDRSRSIAEAYVSKDSRLRLVRTERFLDQMQNYNFALKQMSPDARYCKIAQADDWISPSCLADMVALATEYPSAGLVSAYRIEGKMVRGSGLEASQRFLRGRDAARLHLLGPPIFLFGSQTTVLYRADIVRQRKDFFEEALHHADTDVAYEILKRHDMGFVHQVLSYSRLDPESVTGRRTDFCPHELDFLVALKRHGAAFMDPEEYRDRLDRAILSYYRALARKWIHDPPFGHAAKFWQYQNRGLSSIGEKVQPARFAASFVRQLGVELLPSAIREARRAPYNA